MKNLFQKLNHLDRRIIYLLIALSVGLPVLFNFNLTDVPSQITKNCTKKIEELHESSKVLISFDFDPQSKPELQPIAEALIRYLALKKQVIFFMALNPLGQTIASDLIKSVLNTEFPEYREGVDYINLGFKDGGQIVINSLLSDFKKMFNTDISGTSLNNYPASASISRLKDFALIIDLSSGTPGLKEWLLYGAIPAKLEIIGATTAVSAPLFYPYYPNPLVSLLGGIKSASELEAILINNFDKYKNIKKHKATKRMGPQTIAHFVIILLILAGNLFYFISRKKLKKVR